MEEDHHQFVERHGSNHQSLEAFNSGQFLLQGYIPKSVPPSWKKERSNKNLSFYNYLKSKAFEHILIEFRGGVAVIKYRTQSRPVCSQKSPQLRAPPSVAVCAPTWQSHREAAQLFPNDWNLKGHKQCRRQQAELLCVRCFRYESPTSDEFNHLFVIPVEIVGLFLSVLQLGKNGLG